MSLASGKRKRARKATIVRSELIFTMLIKKQIASRRLLWRDLPSKWKCVVRILFLMIKTLVGWLLRRLRNSRRAFCLQQSHDDLLICKLIFLRQISMRRNRNVPSAADQSDYFRFRESVVAIQTWLPSGRRRCLITPLRITTVMETKNCNHGTLTNRNLFRRFGSSWDEATGPRAVPARRPLRWNQPALLPPADVRLQQANVRRHFRRESSCLSYVVRTEAGQACSRSRWTVLKTLSEWCLMMSLDRRHRNPFLAFDFVVEFVLLRETFPFSLHGVKQKAAH